MVRIKHRYAIIQNKLTDPTSAYSPESADVVSDIHGPFTEMFGLFGAANVFATLRIIDWN
jgi:hypothetical protein